MPVGIRTITKCEQIKGLLTKFIEGLSPSEQIPPEISLVEKYGVSRFTISKAISELVAEGKLYRHQGKGTFVVSSSGRLKKHEEVIHDIGVAIYDLNYISRPEFSDLLTGIGIQTLAHDYNTQFLTTRLGSPKNHYFMEKVKNGRIRGLLIHDSIIPDARILKLKKIKFPFVLMDRDIPGEEVDCVFVDNTDAFFCITQHLITKGHEKIAFLSSSLKHDTVKRMLEGYRLALKKNRLVFDESLIKERSATDKIFQRQILEWLTMRPRPSAFLTYSDQAASKLIKFFKIQGINVPDDVAVVGWGDDPIYTSFHPTITSFKMPLKKVGEISTDMLIKRLNNEKIKENKITLKAQMILRESG